ncbi:hypothetical protein [Thermopirellula anaerolimosa]
MPRRRRSVSEGRRGQQQSVNSWTCSGWCAEWSFHAQPIARDAELTVTSAHWQASRQCRPARVATKWVHFSYDTASQLTDLTRYADLAGTQLVAQSQYTYDQAGRLRGLSHFRGQTTFVEYTWNFDAANRMTQYINSVDGTADYTSDATGQLTAADYDYQSDESYQYDANGNRVTANGSSYATGMNNQLLSDGTYRYLYDAEGNRTHRFIDANQNGQLDSGDTDITQYTWDHRNRLTKVRIGPAMGRPWIG